MDQNAATKYASLVGFGSNLGASDEIYEQVADRLGAISSISSLRRSSLITTQPVGGPADQPAYRNGAFCFDFSPSGLIGDDDAHSVAASRLHRILIETEEDFGRQRTERWGSRRIDLDLLLFGDFLIRSEQLIVPHPRMSFRRFVIQPSVEVAPKMMHPPSGLRMEQLLFRLQSNANQVAFIGAIDACQSVLSQIQNANRRFEFHSMSDEAWAQVRPEEFKLVVQFLPGTQSRNLRDMGAPVLQVVLGDCKDLAGELQAALDATLPVEMGSDAS